MAKSKKTKSQKKPNKVIDPAQPKPPPIVGDDPFDRSGTRAERRATATRQKEKKRKSEAAAKQLLANIKSGIRAIPGGAKLLETNREWNDQAWLMCHCLGGNGTFFHKPRPLKREKFGVSYQERGGLRRADLINDFLQLGTQELSLLQPYFKLEKLSPTGDVARYKPKYHKSPLETATASTPEKLEFTTIESVSIERLEKYVEEVNLRISMKFFASSYKAFSQQPPDSPKEAALIDFLRRNVPSATSKGKPLEDSVHLRDHTIRLTIGWNATGANIKSLQESNYITKEQATRLTRYTTASKITLYGTLLSHSLEIQSDGSMGVTIDFLGLLDTFFADPRGNALFIHDSPNYRKMAAQMKKVQDATTETAMKQAQEVFKGLQTKYIEGAYNEVYQQFIANNDMRVTKVPWRAVESFFNNMDQAGDRPSKLKAGYLRAVSSPSAKEAEKNKPTQGVATPPTSETEEFQDDYIEYFTLGSLINLFVGNSLSKIYAEEGRSLHEVNFQFGDVIFTAPDGKLYATNIGSIPVAFSTFQSWFIRYVTGNGAKIITLRKFLFDLAQRLIGECFANFKNVKESMSLYRPKFNMYGNDTLFYISANNVGRRKDGKNLSYAAYPRFILGGTQAPVTGFSFSKVNIAGFAEAQIYSQNVQSTGIAREVYNVSIDTVGNAMFENGMYIVVDPKGFVSSTADSIQLGLGGLYVIKKVDINWSTEDFSTRIEALYEAPLPNTTASNRLASIKPLNLGRREVKSP